jgi:hypothetical protein
MNAAFIEILFNTTSSYNLTNTHFITALFNSIEVLPATIFALELAQALTRADG